MSDRQFRRKTPEELLESIQKIKKGRLKIILGTVSGSGKTYHMLQEGNVLKERGIDAVIGLISERNRQNTIDQIGCLDKVSTIIWDDGGTIKQDLDLEAILARNPEVVLIDSLAHQNRPGAMFQTRLEDIHYLISKNISVITTMNIYEIKEVYDEAAKLTDGKVEGSFFVPEETLALANEVKLLDVSPEVILQRSKEDFYNNDESQKRNQIFHKSNLAVLRELALRFIASEVNDELDEYREKHGIVGPSGASEKILVTVQYHWNGSILVRRGQQISKRLGGDLQVVCFQPTNKKFTNDELTFKRSIIKLVEKVGGKFEELPLNNSIASEIVDYSIRNNMTSIVLGQSKRTRWEEIVNGSIVNKILRKSKNIDVFIVADRAEKAGERVIPTMQINKETMDPYRRLSPKELENEIYKIKRGTLKVYIGAAPGVGKTYTMLREGNELKKKGIDIIIGLLETHGRKETLEKVGDLDIIPRKVIPYKGTKLEEMDTEAIIQRNPEVVLIDELAHTNVPKSKFTKRYMDVEEILEAGISVISTMNIQHIESLNDSVEQITGVRVRETVPDNVLRDATEIELIDISPKALRERMREGRIYAQVKIEQSLNNFFKTGNLIALRELALREVADDVDERLEAWERDLTLRGPWRQAEIIFVCVNLKSNSERLIRRGFRLAYRLKAKFYVAYVKEHDKLSEEEQLSLKKIKELTERLGGSFELYETTDRRHVFIELVKNIIDKKTTHVIIGQSARTRWKEIKTGSIVQKLLRELRHLDVLVVADQSLK
ncbi:histidine kinase [Bacillus sp. AFS002410]|uniref:histidine kinase n=1 Tax=Bacillus sp. AFS002410 TaxID=2033481 RepID=UPI000BF08044|nr:histidine kinase [Bacillus sp. AFS002410]PEJ49326.1 histidine kinase [Bacillus sp. AFS002410]